VFLTRISSLARRVLVQGQGYLLALSVDGVHIPCERIDVVLHILDVLNTKCAGGSILLGN
jgi:hypothetical protein